MKICVRYCGGCNAGYDRKKSVQSLMEALPSNVIWEYAVPDEDTDIILQVAGCVRKCNRIMPSGDEKIITAGKIEDFEDIKVRLTKEVQSESQSIL